MSIISHLTAVASSCSLLLEWISRSVSSPPAEMLLTLTNHEVVCMNRNAEVSSTNLCEEMVSMGTRASSFFFLPL